MDSSTQFWISIAVSILLSTGWVGIYALFVRPRVYLAHRDQRTVKVMNNVERTKVEAALNSHGIPTAVCEVEWWNRGLRRADQICVEVSTSGPISRWEINRERTDMAAPWDCEKDPLVPGSNRTVLRLVQKHLMPQARVRVVIGYDAAEDAKLASVEAYVDSRTIPLARPQGILTAFLVSLLSLVVGIAVVVSVFGPGGEQPPNPLRPVVFLTAWIASFIVISLFSWRMDHGNPTWNQARSKQHSRVRR